MADYQLRVRCVSSLQQEPKVLIFIHGGYWQMLDKAMFHFIAKRFHSYGITTILLSIRLPGSFNGSGCTLLRNAIKWLYNMFPPLMEILIKCLLRVIAQEVI
jgi:acetyl esterase/lipase